MLVAAAQGGDQVAFRKLMERHQRKLYGLAYGLLRNEQDVLDVLQEAMVKIFRNLAKYEGTSSFYTWAYRITSNLCIDHLRRAKRINGDELDESAGMGVAPPQESGQLDLSHCGDPSALLQRKEIRVAVHAALAELSDKHRTVLVLRELEGRSYDEIAEDMQCSKGTIMSRLFHARRNLQERLKKSLHGLVPSAGDGATSENEALPAAEHADAERGERNP
jgi:RNA polymerase sigma-70 factor (ECF subfamily)